MLVHAFRFVPRVIFLVGAGNLRSQRALAKIGATAIGMHADGSGEANVVFAIDRDDWPKSGVDAAA
jgi:RimJ/RimL family protein N-acetyltransferase